MNADTSCIPRNSFPAVINVLSVGSHHNRGRKRVADDLLWYRSLLLWRCCQKDSKRAIEDLESALFKHRARARAGNSGRERRNRLRLIDLSDVPAQPPILNSIGKDGTSKYQGVQFNKARDTWQATIVIDGAHHFIGYYDSEEEAAVDYARAVFKYHAKPLPPLIHPYAPTDLKEMDERQRRVRSLIQ